MKRTILFVCATAMLCGLFTGCSDSNEPLKELAEVYAEMADNNQEVADAMQAVYKAGRDEQQSLHEKAIRLSEEKKSDNEKLAKKAEEIASKLQGTEIECKSSDALAIEIQDAVFSTVNAQDKLCNIVIKISCSQPLSDTYCLMMDKDDNLLWKTPARYSDGVLAVNFRLTSQNNKAKESDLIYGKLNHIVLVTQSEYNAGSVGATAQNTETEAETESEPSYQGDDESDNLQSAQTAEGEIKVGGNLKAALESASKVTYEYNADSGIWATIGNVAIVIDEDQLTQQGIDFIAAIPSDIAPDIAFKPEYVKADAKILKIEAQ
ncbi:MAG: hypothetical protein K2O38_06085 [Muribaculaceae bacterium]|nr:hypothetical protein [Muribaculaceae bacterium]